MKLTILGSDPPLRVSIKKALKYEKAFLIGLHLPAVAVESEVDFEVAAAVFVAAAGFATVVVAVVVDFAIAAVVDFATAVVGFVTAAAVVAVAVVVAVVVAEKV